MCGIAGIMNMDGRATLQANAVKSMADRMIHRGPDDEGFLLIDNDWRCRSFSGDDTPALDEIHSALPKSPEAHVQTAGAMPSRVALGHRRLSILDLSFSGHQPMGTENERYWIVYNGEIYNFLEISRELEREGIVCHGRSDTEVLLRAFAHWGERCVEKLNGMFAFAIWDNEDKSLFCARDRIGIKPFYYTVNDGQFIFASDIKTIIASGLYSPAPDFEGLYSAMAFGIAPRPMTAFRGIKALEQAHWMRVRVGGSIVRRRYWSVPTCTQINTMSEGEAVELLEEQLTASVKRRLVADVDVGTFMSGGIDSTTVSAIAANLHPGIRAFTLAFEDNAPELDEVDQARATAQICPMEHVVHRVKPESALQDLQVWIAGYEEPYYSLAANHVISKRVHEDGVKVVLNGLGGDELFAGYAWYKHVRTWQLLRLARPLSRALPSFFKLRKERLRAIIDARSADRFHSAFFAKSYDTELRQLFNVPALQQIDTQEQIHDLYCKEKEFADPIEALSYMDLMNYIGNHHVHRSDQFAMAHSVEARFPFLDHELIEAAFTIPSRFKIRSGVQKYVLRKVAERYIAPQCLAMSKKGFGLPLRQWLDGPLQNLTQKSLSKLAGRAEIRNGTPAAWWSDYQAGRKQAAQIWHLVGLELWFETFIDADNKSRF